MSQILYLNIITHANFLGFEPSSHNIVFSSCLLPMDFLQDAPDSPKDDGVPPGSLVAPPMASVTPMDGVETGGPGEMRSRHLLYTTHFPLPQV